MLARNLWWLLTRSTLSNNSRDEGSVWCKQCQNSTLSGDKKIIKVLDKNVGQSSCASLSGSAGYSKLAAVKVLADEYKPWRFYLL